MCYVQSLYTYYTLCFIPQNHSGLGFITTPCSVLLTNLTLNRLQHIHVYFYVYYDDMIHYCTVLLFEYSNSITVVLGVR